MAVVISQNGSRVTVESLDKQVSVRGSQTNRFGKMYLADKGNTPLDPNDLGAFYLIQRDGNVFKVLADGTEVSVAGVGDHGTLTGLSDDDHTQYHTDARGDLRYAPIAHLTATDPHGIATAALTLTNKVITDYSNKVHADAVHYRVKNVNGTTLAKGTPVRFSGYNSGEDAIEVVAANQATHVAIGLVEEAILNGEFGQVVASGIIEGLNLSAYSAGAILYVDGTGSLTATEPTTGYSQPIAVVLRNHAVNGALQVLAAYPKQSADDVRYSGSTSVYTALSNHIDNISNPHSVTAAQVGADATGTAAAAVSDHTTTYDHSKLHDTVSLAGSYDYLSLSGQQITLNQIDYTTDISNKPTLGSMATQADTAVDINGGAIDGTTIGATTPSSVKATAYYNEGGALGSNSSNVKNHFTQFNAGTSGITTGWIAAAYGDATAPRVVIGQCNTLGEDRAIIGAHNGNLDAWGKLSFIASSIDISTNGGSSTAATIDSGGNLGIGVTPNSQWHTNFTVSQIGNGGALWAYDGLPFTYLSSNSYYDGSGTHRYLSNYSALWYSQDASGHIWHIAPSGTAGDPITFTPAMTLNLSGNLLVGTTTHDGTSKLQVNGVVKASTGILFGTDTAAANTLDDYEEGTCTITFTPDSGSITLGNNTLAYTKIGRKVTLTGYITVSAVSSPSGFITIGGLPFAGINAVSTWTGFVPADNLPTRSKAYLPNGLSSLTMSYYNDTGYGAGDITAATYSAIFNFSYFTAS